LLKQLLDSLLTDDENGQATLLKLSTNNNLKAQPDTPQHHFLRIISSFIACKSNPKDYEATYEFALSLDNPDVKTILLKYQDLVDIYCQLYALEPFIARPIAPKTLVESKKVTWGVSILLY
jgi:hypothetical protein